MCSKPTNCPLWYVTLRHISLQPVILNTLPLSIYFQVISNPAIFFFWDHMALCFCFLPHLDFWNKTLSHIVFLSTQALEFSWTHWYPFRWLIDTEFSWTLGILCSWKNLTFFLDSFLNPKPVQSNSVSWELGFLELIDLIERSIDDAYFSC